MNTTQEIHNTARVGADSVFGYVERTAETVSDGIRWQTLNYHNQPQYDVSVFNGVAGISLFLSDYYHLTGTLKARDLAWGANQWCSAPERTVEDESLCFGRSGVGMAWLRFSIVAGDPSALTQAFRIAGRLLEQDRGPVTDFIGGAAGEGVFLTRLWEVSREDRHLSGAVRHGEWLESEVVRDELECYWPMNASVSPPRLCSCIPQNRPRRGYLAGR